MSLHCHECDWGQDDFWELGGYNPFHILFCQYFPLYIRPRWVGTDRCALHETRFSRKLGLTRSVVRPRIYREDEPRTTERGEDGNELPAPTTCISYEIHTWYLLAYLARRAVRSVLKQRWWTQKAWYRDLERGSGGCPECGHSLCVD